jgi:type I restriction enzyme S subunit
MDLLQKHFDIALETPDGIKSLRGLILTLAMQGKLVKQDSAEGSADDWLREIEAIKSDLRKNGEIRHKPLRGANGISDSLGPIPPNWIATKITEICDLKTGATPSRTNRAHFGGEIKWLVSGDIHKVEIFDCEGRITEAGLRKSNCKILPRDSVLIALNGQGKTRGTVAVLRIEAACNQSLVAMIPFSKTDIFPKFLYWNLHSRYMAIRRITGQDKRRGLNMKIIAELPVALPPLAEQKRIVARIDQLMALCDKLETERNARDQKRVTVHTAAMNRLLSAPDKPSFDSSWQFITKYFNELYSVTPNVAELKKAILQLAVMGKLVPQDPSDQPASELLKEIEAEKARLVKEGKIKKQDPLPAIKPQEIPYTLPQGWEWVRLGEMIDLISGQHLKPNEYNENQSGFSYYTGPADFGKDNPVASRWTSINRAVAISGDILLTVKGAGVGKTNVLLEEKAAISRQLMAIRAIRINRAYMLVYLKKIFLEFQSLAVGIAIPGIGREDVQYRLLPLPPLAEQQRIVAKIDQLMALCDALAKQIGEATAKKTAILGAVLVAV